MWKKRNIYQALKQKRWDTAMDNPPAGIWGWILVGSTLFQQSIWRWINVDVWLDMKTGSTLGFWCWSDIRCLTSFQFSNPTKYQRCSNVRISTLLWCQNTTSFQFSNPTKYQHWSNVRISTLLWCQNSNVYPNCKPNQNLMWRMDVRIWTLFQCNELVL